MNIPEKIKILSADYTVRRVDKQWQRDTDSKGQCDTEEYIITLPVEQELSLLLDTAVHEVMHGVYELMQLTDEDKEEAYVARLSTGFVTVLRDNPKFRKWVWDSLKKLDK